MSASVWTNVSGKNQPSINFGTTLLLTDGSVLVQNVNAVDWWRLTPDLSGKYESGTWTGPFNMATPRQYFASGVLQDGRVFVVGGEYSGGNTVANVKTGEIFDPDTGKWSNMNKPVGPLPNGFDIISTDATSCILPDGRVIFGSVGGPQTAIWDPATDNWTQAGLAFNTKTQDSKQGDTDEETWTLLQDGTVLAVNIRDQFGNFISTRSTEKYIPEQDLWVSAGNTNTELALNNIPNPSKGGNAVSQEIGPMVLLPNGKAFAIGATGNTGVYDVPAAPSLTGSWETGPTLPSDPAGVNSFNYTGTLPALQTAIDAPACLLPSGEVLLAAGNTTFLAGSNGQPGSYWSSTNWYIYDSTKPLANQIAPLDTKTSTSNGAVTFNDILLVLPTGQVLHTFASNGLETLTPGTIYGSPDASWKPNITDFPQALVLGQTYNISGNRLNGLSQANSYGDDVQNATNYPLVQLTSTSGPTIVRYLKTFNFSFMGISAITDKTVQSAAFNVPTDVPAGSYDLRVIANGIPSDPVSVSVLSSGMEIVLNVNSFSQSAVQGIIDNENGVITPMLYCVVDGLKPSDLGISSSTDLDNPGIQPSFPTPVSSGITITFAGPAFSDIPSLPDIAQRFTFPFSITFTDESSFTFPPNTDTLLIGILATLPLTTGNLTAASVITLTKNPNPFILHGADITIPNAPTFPYYLSVDIRVFTVLAGQSKFGQTLSTTVAEDIDAATTWIQTVISNLNLNSGQATTLFDALPQSEDSSALNLSPNLTTGQPVYNFALARVRYRDTVPTPQNSNVRLFFRMFPGAQLNATYNPNTLNRTGVNGDGEKIATLGIIGDEIETIPFFASKRIDTSTFPMTTQTDPSNVQSFSAAISGGEIDSYFGAWIDINTPSHKYFPDRILDPTKVDGPFVGLGPLLAVQDLVKSQHQCLLAEISFDPDPITANNADPSNNDKLAQRNLAFVPLPNPGLTQSRRAPQVFEIRPTPAPQAENHQFDELLIEWGPLPQGTTAQIYVPAVVGQDIIQLANQMYGNHLLTLADASTIQVPADGGNTYIPIPTGVDAQAFAALLTLDLPLGIRKGQSFTVVVKQITSDSFTIRNDNPEGPPPPPEIPKLQLRDLIQSNAVSFAGGTETLASQAVSSSAIISRPGSTTLTWRRLLGTFAVTIPISTKSALLPQATQLLSILLSIQSTIPLTSRWYPVFARYVSQIYNAVGDLGGDPGNVNPDPYGGGNKNGGSEEEVCGRVVGLCFGCGGAFEGFEIQLEEGVWCGERDRVRRFRGAEVWEHLIRGAWEEGFKVKIVVGRKEGEIRRVCVLRFEEEWRAKQCKRKECKGSGKCVECGKKRHCAHVECHKKGGEGCEHCRCVESEGEE